MASNEAIVTGKAAAKGAAPSVLRRDIHWSGAFWIAAGVPALVLFSIGGISSTVGAPSALVWTLSVCIGFIQCFTYGEIAGLFPNKSGGASIYGAAAWLRYSKFVAPISVWCNWLAWTPVLAIGAGLGAGYILTALFPADAAINTWQFTILNLSGLKEGLSIRVDSTSLIGTAMLLLVFAAQHHGILRIARIQTIVAIATLLPLLIIGIVPLLTGDVSMANFLPFAPLAHTAAGDPILDPSQWVWDNHGWTLFLGGMFIACWSAYAFETSICYTSEFKDPKKDTIKAIVAAGLLCMAVYILVPFSFQGTLGVEGMMAPGIADGSGIGAAMASMVGGGTYVYNVILVMLIFALILAIMTSMAGSSRTLYQGSADGWLPKYLSHVNKHGSPTYAMWTDLGFNLILLQMSDYLFVLAVSNCCYIVFNFLNLNSGWIHRVDSGEVPRPWKAPRFMIAIAAVLAYVNAMFMGAGANVWGPGTFKTSIVIIALIIPVFIYRHYVTDRGRFPERMMDDLKAGDPDRDIWKRRAGILPYLTLAGGVITVAVSHMFFGL